MTESPNGTWLLRKAPHPGVRVRLFCFPHAGAGASAYRQWSALAGPEIEICPVQLPGRENRLRETPYTQIGSLVDALLPALRAACDVPFALFGHSMGAMVAAEVAMAAVRC